MDWKKVPYLRRNLGVVFQDFQLLTDRNVNGNLKFVLKSTGWKDDKLMDEKIADVLDKVGLKTKGFKMPFELSGGEQQRVDIARALLNSPKLILADEPTGNLDSKNGGAILGLLKKINVEQGCTVVMVTHSQDAAVYGDFVIELRDGHIVDTGGSVRGDNEAGSTTTGESGAASSPDD